MHPSALYYIRGLSTLKGKVLTEHLKFLAVDAADPVVRKNELELSIFKKNLPPLKFKISGYCDNLSGGSQNLVKKLTFPAHVQE